MCFVWIWEQTAIISLYSINWLVFITEAESVYCAVWNGPLNQTDTVSYLKGWFLKPSPAAQVQSDMVNIFYTQAEKICKHKEMWKYDSDFRLPGSIQVQYFRNLWWTERN